MEPRARRSQISEHSQAHATAQETNLFRAFASQVRTGRLNSEWPGWTLKTQEVMEACLQSARQGGERLPVAG